MGYKTNHVKGDKKIMNAWAFYDWANSVYPLVITTAIFPLFYNAKMPDVVVFFGGHFSKIGIYSYTIALSLLLVAILSPILSGIADYVGNKKFFMRLFNYLGVFSCFAMYYFDDIKFLLGEGSSFTILVQLILILLANLGFWGSLVFYNSYLPEIAERKDHDALSAKGFSLGYVGSVLLLLIALGMVMGAETFEDKIQMMRYTFLLTGLWWLGFAQVTYYYLPENKSSKKITKEVIYAGYLELQKVWKEFMTIKRLKRFLRAFFVYSMAVQTIMTMAQFFGTSAVDWSIGLDVDLTHLPTNLSADELIVLKNEIPEVSSRMQVSMIISIMIIQLIAIPGALFFSWLSGKLGNINVLIIEVIIWIMICLSAYFINTPFEFYFLAFWVGIVMGGIQSLSRSTYSKMLPDTNDTTSYFSFYDVLEKIGMTIGIVSFGFLEDAFSIRYSVMALFIFFVVGLVLLFYVPKTEEN